MTTRRRTAAVAILSAALSPKGLTKVEQIMDGDEANKAIEAKNGNRHPSATVALGQVMVVVHPRAPAVHLLEAVVLLITVILGKAARLLAQTAISRTLAA